MTGNKQAYDEAYQRAKEGKSRSLWNRMVGTFEDEYTRQSREKGERDGAAGRGEAGGTDSPEAAPRP
jgi:hypothetical protein